MQLDTTKFITLDLINIDQKPLKHLRTIQLTIKKM